MRRAVGATILAMVVLLAQSSEAQEPQAVRPFWQVRSEPETLLNGTPAVLYVAPPNVLKTLKGSWMGHQLYFSFDPSSRTWYALFGVGLGSAAGMYTLTLAGETATRTPVSFEQDLEVKARSYPTVNLKVLPHFIEPTSKQRQRIKKEEALKHQILAGSSDTQLWHARFVAPVNKAISEPFGVNRVFNGELQTQHQGLDYHARPGTPILAANSGIVLLARSLFFEGKCVVVDHGQGVVTLYMHLSKFKVKEGQIVRRGQLLGLSGTTGRVTGPHLHLALRWEGIYLDPAELFQLDLPETESSANPEFAASPRASLVHPTVRAEREERRQCWNVTSP
jgi:murein DD-endopeptidase MepM/ murein hydrolase activator NlpD